jgi:hypothetical protein
MPVMDGYGHGDLSEVSSIAVADCECVVAKSTEPLQPEPTNFKLSPSFREDVMPYAVASRQLKVSATA